MPHVYTPNRWPGDPDNSNTNPFGRWDYGPWFWPVQTSLIEVDHAGTVINRPILKGCTSAAAVSLANPNGDTVCPTTPNPSLVPEAFLDTPVVNGTAYPTFTVDPVTYRFQVLNAAGERNFNLSLFVADTSGTEVTMVPAVPHTAATAMPICATGAPRRAPRSTSRTSATSWCSTWPARACSWGRPSAPTWWWTSAPTPARP